MACDILPPTEVQMANTDVTCLPYVICYMNVDIPIAMSGNALAYDFKLLSLQRTFLSNSRRHWFYHRLKHKLSQSKYSAEGSTVGIEVSSPTNWLPLPNSSRGGKRGRKMNSFGMSYLHTNILKEEGIDWCGTRRIAWQVIWRAIYALMKGQFQYHGHMPQSGCWNNTEAN